jgi:3-polyprenyl-4-hydroxybenzoate decarboxylase
VQPDRDIVIVPSLYSPTLDPSAPAPRTSAKMGIDATAPMGEERRMYEAPLVVGMENWPLADVLARAAWTMPDSAGYLAGGAR